MNSSTYNAITATLLTGALIAIAVALVSFITMIVRWRAPSRRRNIAILGIAVAAAPILIAIQQAVLWWVFLPSLGRAQMAEINAARAERYVETTLLDVGDMAPEFALKTTDGAIVSIPNSNKVMLINFFATWCGPCQIELPHLDRIWNELKSDNHFAFVAIGREETDDSILDFRAKHGYMFPMAADPKRFVYDLFAKESIPRTIVISSDGKIVYSKSGFYEEDIAELETVLQDQLSSFK